MSVRQESPDPFSAHGKQGMVFTEALIRAALRPNRIKYRFRTLRDSWVPPKAGCVAGKVRVRVNVPPANEWWVLPDEAQVFVGHLGQGTKRLIPLTGYRPKVSV